MDVKMSDNQVPPLGHTLPSAAELLDILPDAVVLVSAEGTIAFANPEAERLFGRDTEALIGAAVGLRPEGAEPTEAIRITRPDGSTRDVEYRIEPLSPDSGRNLVNLRDVTDRNLLQARLRQGEKMEAIGRLAGGVAHDFNNLLAAITGYCQLAEDHAGPLDTFHARQLHDDLAEIRRAATAARGLTGQLLNFSSGHRPPPGSCNLGDVLTDHARIYEAACGGMLRLEIDVDPETPAISGTADLVDQVVLNLAVNARDALAQHRSENGPVDHRTATLTITTGVCNPPGFARAAGNTCDSWAELRVVDHGPGVPDAIKRNIFEPFFTTKPNGLGCGLGLSTVYGLVNRVGGQVQVLDTPGGGATFVVILPCARRKADTPAQPVHPVVPAVKRILLIEDDEPLRFLFLRIIRKAGFQIETLADGESAIAYLEKHRGDPARFPDVLISDVAMPGLTGIDVAQRAHELDANLPVILISGYTNGSLQLGVDDRMEGIGSLKGPYFFLQKPFEFEDLTGLIQQVLDGSAKQGLVERQ